MALLAGCGGGRQSADAGAAPQSACTDGQCRQLILAAGAKAEPAVRNHLVRTVSGADTVDVYGNPNMNGATERFGPGVFGYASLNSEVDGFRVVANDDISSLVVGKNAVVWLCNDYAQLPAEKSVSLGHCQVFTSGSYASLPALGFDDRTSSVIVTAGKSPRPAVGMVAWGDANYGGTTQSFTVGGFDFADIVNGVGNDAISSIEVKPGFLAVLCTNGIDHAQSLDAGAPTGAECRLFSAGKYPTMPAGYNDIVTFISVLPVATNPALVGSFGPVKQWPYAGINQYLLTDGRVMLSENQSDDGDPTTPEYMIWNPATDTFVTETMFAKDANLFCSAFVHLPSGDLFAAATGGGGNTTNLATRYDSATGRWELAPTMIWKRYYPSAALTSKGSVLVAGGNDVFGYAYGQGTIAINTPEIFENWAWRELSSAKIPFSNNRGPTNDSAFWPWMQTAANGKMFMAGPDSGMRYIDTTGTGTLSELGARDATFRSYGSYAMYAPGQLLVAGGSGSVDTASTIAFDGTGASVTPVAPMKYGRRQHNLTVMANGEVLLLGGNGDGAETYSYAAPVMAGEIWNPATRTWRMASDYMVSRQYHSTAMLIPDGRVLFAGNCGFGPCERSAEVYSPPYLFNADGTAATRPVINGTKDQWRYGEKITVSYGGTKVTAAQLIKLGAVTHSTNFEQRLLPLPIAGDDGTFIQISAPANANLAPPGHYLLILLNAAGVPSVAKVVQITNNVAPLGTASQSSTYGSLAAANALDGSLDSFSHTATDDRASTWTLQWSQDYSIEQIALHNRVGTAQQRLRDIKVTLYDAAGKAVYTSAVLNPGNALKSPKRLELDLYRLGVGAVTARKLVVQRAPDPTLAGGPGDNSDGIDALTLSEVQVFAKP